MTELEALKALYSHVINNAPAHGTEEWHQVCAAADVVSALVKQVEEADHDPRKAGRLASEALRLVSGAPWTALTISTDHLSPVTCKWLDAWAQEYDIASRKTATTCPIFMLVGEFGWFVHCYEDRPHGIPDDLHEALQCARAQYGVEWVQFDAEGDQLDGLPSLGGPGGDDAD